MGFTLHFSVDDCDRQMKNKDWNKGKVGKHQMGGIIQSNHDIQSMPFTVKKSSHQLQILPTQIQHSFHRIIKETRNNQSDFDNTTAILKFNYL
jgi:hypothetical protein